MTLEQINNQTSEKHENPRDLTRGRLAHLKNRIEGQKMQAEEKRDAAKELPVLTRIEQGLESDAFKNPENKEHTNKNPEHLAQKEKPKTASEHALYRPGKFEIKPESLAKLRAEEAKIVDSTENKSYWSSAKEFFSGVPVGVEGGLQSSLTSHGRIVNVVEIDGQKYISVYNYPGSDRHRNADTGCRRGWGEKAFKVSEKDWRNAYLKNPLMPAHAGANERFVYLPFVKNISQWDLLGDFRESKFGGDYAYGKKYANPTIIESLLHENGRALNEAHTKNITIGEVIPSNMGVTEEGKVLFLNPETAYEKDVPLVEQKARDLLSLIVSTCGCLDRSKRLHEGTSEQNKFTETVHSILSGYNDPEVIEFMQKHLCSELGALEMAGSPVDYSQFKSRMTLDSRAQYNQILKAIYDFSLASFLKKQEKQK